MDGSRFLTSFEAAVSGAGGFWRVVGVRVAATPFDAWKAKKDAHQV
jgi:hypothetical protein